MHQKTFAAFSLLMVVMILGAAPAAPVTPTATTPSGETREFDGIKAALDLIPSGVLPTNSGGWTVAKHDVANDVFTHQLLHQNIRLHMKVLDVVRREGSEGGYKVICAGIGRDATPFNLSTTLIFPASQCVEAARINIGDNLLVRGTVQSNLFDVQGGPGAYTCELQLSLVHVATESAEADKQR